MKFTTSFALLATSLTTAFAQTPDFATGLLDALRANNLTTLANLAGNNSDAILPLLQGGNKTVFGPTNQAFQMANINGNTDMNQLLATLSYHVVNSSLTEDSIPDDDGEHRIVLSSLKGEPYVQLPNNRSQALVLAQAQNQSQGDDNDNNRNGTIVQPGRNVSFSLEGALRYQNLMLVPINTVLSIPPSFAAAAETLNLTSLQRLAEQTQLLQAVNSTDAVTVFAPTDSAIQAAMQNISAANQDQQRAVIANHVVNGTVVYSTQLTGDDGLKNAVTASGEMVTFEEDDDNLYVVSGQTRARIIRSDNLVSNGVVHLIDTVLLNTMSNPEAAASAASSASANAATATAVQGTDADNDGGNGNGNGNGNDGGNGASGVTAGIVTVGLAALSSALYLVA
ncbi:unnamed protein product [Sympodiomycopsis kandeliae]